MDARVGWRNSHQLSRYPPVYCFKYRHCDSNLLNVAAVAHYDVGSASHVVCFDLEGKTDGTQGQSTARNGSCVALRRL
jgi:hypothetical protein